MLLNLVVAELEYLESIRERSLGGFGLCKVIHHLLVWEGLLYVAVCEVHDRVAAWPDLPPHSIAEYNLLPPVVKEPLDFPIVRNDLIHLLCWLQLLPMILWRELEVELVFLVLFLLVTLGKRICILVPL